MLWTRPWDECRLLDGNSEIGRKVHQPACSNANPNQNTNPQLRSASKGDLVVPRTTLKLGERAFKVAAPRLWNELPPDIRKLSTLATFKKHLKTFLFCKHYGLVLEQ